MENNYIAGFLDWVGGFVYTRRKKTSAARFIVNITNKEEYKKRIDTAREMFDFLKTNNGVEYKEYKGLKIVSFRVENTPSIKKLVEYMEANCTIKERKHYNDVKELK